MSQVEIGARMSGAGAVTGFGRGRSGSAPTPAARSARPPATAAAVAVPVEVAELSSALERARHGDEAAFRVLYRAVQPKLLRYLRALVGEDAEDVASEAWLQIVRDLTSFRGDFDGFRGWATTIARHRAMDHLRRQHRRPDLQAPVDQLTELPGGHDTASGALELMSTDAAVALIARLPRDQAEAVLLRVVIGLDAPTAARVLGKRAGAVRTAAYRGLRRLAEYLDAASRSPSPASGTDSGTDSGTGARATGVTETTAPALKDTR